LSDLAVYLYFANVEHNPCGRRYITDIGVDSIIEICTCYSVACA